MRINEARSTSNIEKANKSNSSFMLNPTNKTASSFMPNLLGQDLRTRALESNAFSAI